MVEESVALAHILDKTPVLSMVRKSPRDAHGFYLAQPLRARLSVPRFDNSAVDGYAVQSTDGKSPRKVVGEQPAGRDLGLQMGPGEAIRIFTGAPLPDGCDAVVMQEDTSLVEGFCQVSEVPLVEEFIRRAGADVASGQLISRAGDQVTPQLIGLLATQGFLEIPVHKVPRVVILSTGDELRFPGEMLETGEIYESNSLMLGALLDELRIPVVMKHVPDNRSLLEGEISRALAECDVLIMSGGVSVGDHDHVKSALAALNIPLDLWRIRIKPGKPLAFARSAERLIFGLPGNPVSAFVTFLLFVRPAILKMQGAREDEVGLRRQRVDLSETLRNPGDRPHYLRGKVVGHVFSISHLQESHALFGLSESNSLLRLDAGEIALQGTSREVFLW